MEVRADGRDDDRHVVAPAARHDGVDRHVLRGHRDFAGRHGAHHVIGVEAGRGQEVGHELGRRGDDGEPVAPAAVVVVLHERHRVDVLMGRGAQRAHGSRA